MKKFLLVTLLALVPLCSRAQLIVGGHLGLTYGKVDGVDKWGVLIAPEVGYNVNKYFTVGGTIGYQSAPISIFGVSPYLRANFLFIKNKNKQDVFNFLVSLDAPMGWGNNYQSYAVVARPGFNINCGPVVSLMVKVGAFGWFYEEQSGKKWDGWAARVNPNTISIGINVNL